MAGKVIKVVHEAEVVTSISVSDACQICAVTQTFFYALVDEGVFEDGLRDQAALLGARELARLQKASRLANDLGVNEPGIALILQLLEAR